LSLTSFRTLAPAFPLFRHFHLARGHLTTRQLNRRAELKGEGCRAGRADAPSPILTAAATGAGTSGEAPGQTAPDNAERKPTSAEYLRNDT
jgi:hypothetical protein